MKTPNFRSEKQEADWYPANQNKLLAEFKKEYRAVPRYPSFEEWVLNGHQEVGGIIDIANFRWKGGYVKPVAFPDERLYFAYPEEWTHALRSGPLVGRAVVFDVPPQDFSPGTKPQAYNVRFA